MSRVESRLGQLTPFFFVLALYCVVLLYESCKLYTGSGEGDGWSSTGPTSRGTASGLQGYQEKYNRYTCIYIHVYKYTVTAIPHLLMSLAVIFGPVQGFIKEIEVAMCLQG